MELVNIGFCANSRNSKEINYLILSNVIMYMRYCSCLMVRDYCVSVAVTTWQHKVRLLFDAWGIQNGISSKNYIDMCFDTNFKFRGQI